MIRIISVLCLALCSSMALANVSFVALPSSVTLSANQSQSITVINDGNSTATGVFEGDSCAGAFTVISECFGNLLPGGSCNIMVQFHPIAPGFNMCTINVNALGAFATISVTGQGI